MLNPPTGSRISRRTFVKRSTRLVGGLIATQFLGWSPHQLFAEAGSESHELIILHTNDMHGRIAENDSIGMAKLSTVIQQFRAENEHVLVLDGGDTIHGLPIVNEVQGESAVTVMNAVGYDVMVPGNHDFNFGHERLVELEHRMEFDLVAANLYRDGELLFKPSVMKNFNGFRVGVFGLVTPDTYNAGNPRYIRGLEITDMAEAAAYSVRQLREEGADMVIALGHAGLYGDYPSTGVIDRVSGIDLFVDGHSHSRLPEGMMFEETPIVQAFEYLKDLGIVHVYAENGKVSIEASLLSADQLRDTKEDPGVRQLVDEAEEEWIRRRFG